MTAINSETWKKSSSIQSNVKSFVGRVDSFGVFFVVSLVIYDKHTALSSAVTKHLLIFSTFNQRNCWLSEDIWSSVESNPTNLITIIALGWNLMNVSSLNYRNYHCVSRCHRKTQRKWVWRGMSDRGGCEWKHEWRTTIGVCMRLIHDFKTHGSLTSPSCTCSFGRFSIKKKYWKRNLCSSDPAPSSSKAFSVRKTNHNEISRTTRNVPTPKDRDRM